MITDYKSGRSKPQGVQDAGGRLSLDLQLPIYLQAALPSLWPELRPAGAAYFSLRGARVIDRARLSGSELEAFVQRLRAQLRGTAIERTSAGRGTGAEAGAGGRERRDAHHHAFH
jgi:ATP-dependent helicase/DNAse subunit B